MQVFFSGRNPLLRWRLPLLQKLLYSYGTASYFVTVRVEGIEGGFWGRRDDL